MNIYINNRIILIIGPSCTGKTTLSYRIQNDCPYKTAIVSHDEVLEESSVERYDEQDIKNIMFNLNYLGSIYEAVKDSSNKYVIIDSLNYSKQLLSSSLMQIRGVLDLKDGITLIKMKPSYKKHKGYILERAKTNDLVKLPFIMEQRERYLSDMGSFDFHSDLVNEEIIITDPEDINLVFGSSSNLKVLR